MIRQYLKTSAKRAAAGISHLSGYYSKVMRGKVLILMYHRVLPERELGKRFVQPGMYVLECVFEKQMEFLKSNFLIISIAELLTLWKNRTLDKKERYCVITFDDGWADNYTWGYPILRKKGLPATIFLTTSLIGTKKWFWPDRIGYLLEHWHRQPGISWDINILSDEFAWAKDFLLPGIPEERLKENINNFIERCKDIDEKKIDAFIKAAGLASDLRFPDERALLDWREVEEMSKNGIFFGSHASTHRILTKLGADEVKKELQDSLRALKEKKINHTEVFCYPNGSYSEELKKLIKDAGYAAAVSTRFGCEGEAPDDLFGLKRIAVHNDISVTIPLFTFHISGLSRKLSFAQ